MRVLIVDDSAIIIRAATAELRAAGFEVASRSQIVGTVAEINSFKADVLLLDVNMSGIEGQRFVQLFLSNQVRLPLWVLLYSDKSQEELQELTRDSGAHGFIRKSDARGRLAVIIERMVRNLESTRKHTPNR